MASLVDGVRGGAVTRQCLRRYQYLARLEISYEIYYFVGVVAKLSPGHLLANVFS